MNGIKSVKLKTKLVKKGQKVLSCYVRTKRRFLRKLKASVAGNKLFKVIVTYRVGGYKSPVRNESCWGNKTYVQKCYQNFTSEQLIRSL